ncbi:trans-sialidase-like protein [Drechmeria coniospora]|uniref:Trans-sialidase-like protein n=1 Tax=Drechmeria coniospora TaxID=98403 RepID=A0A151GH42_DRECN|nr:trans-sialidase-like protein [Drechmeria coniospora]KYK56427.1 trans-sialidase-like protein [Drechmeria coniospora]
MGAPPPPPPHGETPKSSGLPPGKYDIFVIPEHSAGSGFLYLPSLQPSVNSFAAGFASALILVALFQTMAPAFRAWWDSFQGMGNMGITLLVLGVGFGAWALGRTQNDAPPSHGTSASSGAGPGGFGSSTSTPPPNADAPPPPSHGSGPAPPPRGNPAPPPPQPEKPKAAWNQRSTPQPEPASKGSWEKAREETRRKEEERKAKETEQKRRDEAAKRLAELRAKEASERAEREKERERREKEAEQKKREAEEKAAREKERAAAEERTRAEAAAAGARSANRVGSSYAYSAVGEKTSMWPNGRPAAASSSHSAASSPSRNPPSPGKPPAPTAKTYVSTDDDAHSFRPYDRPTSARRGRSESSMGGSEASWAPSHTTARTTPPPSERGPYSTKDPDKIVIQAVYLFMNQFAKTPASQLLSGVGSVTDGLVLRLTTEGLFIDDDVRGVPQREWDVKAWTLKNIEVWCPPHCLTSSASASNPTAGAKSPPHLLYKMATARRNLDRDAAKVLTGEDADAYLADLLRSCKNCCRLGLCERTFQNTNIQLPSGQTGRWNAKGLHVLRATIRDQEAKRYLFVLDEAESWKVAVGLQRLRRGTQVRQLGVGGMSASDARATLEMLGWGE